MSLEFSVRVDRAQQLTNAKKTAIVRSGLRKTRGLFFSLHFQEGRSCTDSLHPRTVEGKTTAVEQVVRECWCVESASGATAVGVFVLHTSCVSLVWCDW